MFELTDWPKANEHEKRDVLNGCWAYKMIDRDWYYIKRTGNALDIPVFYRGVKAHTT